VHKPGLLIRSLPQTDCSSRAGSEGDCSGVRLLLDAEPDVEVVGEALDGAAAVFDLLTLRWIKRGAEANESETYAYPTPALLDHECEQRTLRCLVTIDPDAKKSRARYRARLSITHESLRTSGWWYLRSGHTRCIGTDII
jgi:hypothetical protein